MNFISHFYFDRHVPDSLFAVGVSTPDLLSIYNRSIRLHDRRIQHLTTIAGTPEQQQFLHGVLRHFDGDKVFHSSKFFEEETHHLSAVLRQAFGEAQIPRSFFVSHVLLELIIDKVLIADSAELLNQYYGHFEAHPIPLMVALTEWAAGTRIPGYGQFLEKFLERKFLYRYRDWGYVGLVLKHILQRVGVTEYAYLDDSRFPMLMHQYETRLRTRYTSELARLNARLHRLPDPE